MSELTKRGTPRKRKYVAERARAGESTWERISRHLAVNEETGCWEWQAALADTGYAQITIARRRYYVHRLAYQEFVGDIPAGLQIDHLCRNRACCNFLHLEPVPPQVNTLRGQGFAPTHAAKTHCPSGHPYDEENTYHYAGRRYCRKCKARHVAEFRERQAAA